MKSYTDIEQSRILAKLLSHENADMKFPYFGDEQYGTTALFGEPIEFSGGKDVPCWSLAALFNILPLKIEGVYSDYELKIDMVDKMPRYVLYGDCYHDSFPWDFEKEDLLDNVVESIVWLHNNNYLPK